MKIKYFGTSWEIGLTLSVTIYNKDGIAVGVPYSLTETAIDSGIYISEEINNLDGNLPKGVYTSIVKDIENIRRGFDEFIWDGSKEATLTDIKLWTAQEQAEIRDALGITGDKSVANGGQLQKKSELPYNGIIDTTSI